MSVAKTINTILCDDVRNEVGNKLSLIGIYTKDIIFKEMPAIYSKLCFVIFIKGLKELFTDVKVILKSPESDDIVMNMKVPPDASLNSDLVLTWAISPFRAKATGQAKFSIYFGGAKSPSLIHKFEIKVTGKK